MYSDAALLRAEEFYRALAERIRSRFISRASGDFRVEMAGMQVMRLAEVMKENGTADSKVYGIVRIGTFGQPGVVMVQRALLTRIIGAMLGDDEGEVDEDDARPLSPVERRIASRVMIDVVDEIRTCWPDPTGPNIELVGGPGSTRVVAPHMEQEEVYAGTLRVGSPDTDYGTITVTAGVDVLREAEPPPGTRSNKNREPDFSRVMPLELELVAELGRVPMRVRDLRALAVGDLIPVGRVGECQVRVNGKAVLSGEAGHTEGQRSVRIVRKAR